MHGADHQAVIYGVTLSGTKEEESSRSTVKALTISNNNSMNAKNVTRVSIK